MDELEKMTKLNKAKSKQITKLENEIQELNTQLEKEKQTNKKLTDELDLSRKKYLYCIGKVDALLTVYRIQNNKPPVSGAVDLAAALDGLNKLEGSNDIQS